jgi:hypothetical protein
MMAANFTKTLSVLMLTLVFHLTAAANNTQALVEKRSVAVEYTFLKSHPGERDALKKFIIANWFKMDAIAAERGLMSSYEVLDSGDDAEPWDVMVAVTYMNRAGYEGIAAEFEKIRRDHKTMPIDGKGFKDLGKIVASRKLYREQQ